MASQVQVGPFGGNDNGDISWTFGVPAGDRIDGFLIASGVVIDSIRFTYVDKDNVPHQSERYGGDGGTLNPLVKFDDDEDLIRVAGTYGNFNGSTAITSLSFHTSTGRTYGPYGGGEGTKFYLTVTTGKFVAFFGTYKDYLKSIGSIEELPQP